MRASSLFRAAWIAAALVPSVVAQRDLPGPPTATVEATLRHVRALRALELTGEAERPFAVFAGTRRTRIGLPGGVEIGVVPDAVLAIGRLDVFGRAFVPIDVFGESGAGIEVHAQALLWSRNSGITILPDQSTSVAPIALEGPQTGAPFPPFRDAERIRILNDSGYGKPSAVLAIADGVPPQHVLELRVEVPSSGHVLRIDDFRHRGAFTRVFATLERPDPDKRTERTSVGMRVAAVLGTWSGKIEVVLAVHAPSAGS